mgnify:FL=1
MAVSYSSAGSGSGTESNGAQLALVCPATINSGDILIAHIVKLDTSTSPSTPAGWTLLYGPVDVGATSPTGRAWVFGKVADGTEDGATVNWGTTGGTAGRYGRIYRFLGRTAGNIENICRGFASSTSDSDPTAPAVTTHITGSLAVALVAQDDNNSIDAFTGETGGDWTEAVAEYTSTSIGAQGCMCQLQTATPTADPGTMSGGTYNTGNDKTSVIGFEIAPEQVRTETGYGKVGAAGYGVAVRVPAPQTYTKTGFGILDDWGNRPIVSEKTGYGNAGTAGYGADAFTDVNAGYGKVGAAGYGVAARTFSKTGYGKAGSFGAGADEVLSVETGYGKVGAAGYGADAFTAVETAAGTVGTAGYGVRERTIQKSGYGSAGTSGYGERALEHNRSGFGTVGADGYGSRTRDLSRTGYGAIGADGYGARNTELARSGYGTVGAAGFGAAATEHTRSGFGLIGVDGHGVRAGEHTRSGLGAVGADGYGARETERERTGFGVVGADGHGAAEYVTGGGTTYPKTGYGAVGADGYGAPATVFTKDGFALVGLVARGERVVLVSRSGFGVVGTNGYGTAEVPGQETIVPQRMLAGIGV